MIRKVEEHKEQQPVIETETAMEQALQAEVIEPGHNKESKQEVVTVTAEPQDPPTEDVLQEKQEVEQDIQQEKQESEQDLRQEKQEAEQEQPLEDTQEQSNEQVFRRLQLFYFKTLPRWIIYDMKS